MMMKDRGSCVLTAVLAGCLGLGCSAPHPGSREARLGVSPAIPPAPVDIDAVRRLLPVPPHAEVVQPLAKDSRGMAKVEVCFDDSNQRRVGRSLSQALAKAGWHNLAVQPDADGSDRWAVHGRAEPFVLTGMVQRGAYAACNASDGRTLATLVAYKRGTRP